ncbi:MAG: aspartate kinase [Candidatus Bathycorpusculaceae bacterium]
MAKRVVVKFGGAELSSGDKFIKAAKMIEESCYEEVAVVVSAMGKTTDNLVNCVKEMGDVNDADNANIVAMGERTSVRIFCSALKSLGIKSTYFDPQQERWPIITNSNFLNAKPIITETKKRVRKHLEPILGHYIPVICGFVGKDKYGRITTLGRGGSDITATLLGSCLKADEVVLVKDTEGVLSADPKIVPNAKPLKEISIEEMFSLAYGGAKIIHPKALNYKLPEQKLRVVCFSGNLTSGGTEITGVFSANPTEVRGYGGLCALTLVGEISSENLSKVFANLRGEEIFGISTGRRSITLFAKIKNPKQAVQQICSLQCFKAASLREGVGAIEAINPDFIDSPGWVAKISSALASGGINIIEVTTGKATINVFIDEKDLKEAKKAIQSTVK